MFENIRTEYIQIVEDQKLENELNFKNSKSKEERNLAQEDLKSAKILAKISRETDSDDKKTKKSLNRKAKQVAMEATEHAQKAIVYADDKNKKIVNKEIHIKLETTHNNYFLQREQKKAGINIVEEQDIKDLNSSIKKKNGDKSAYNAVRFNEQEIDDESVDKAIKVAEKAINNLEKKVEQSEKERIKINGFEIFIDI